MVEALLHRADHGVGVVSRTDPRLRVVCAVAFAVVTVSLSETSVLVAALGFALLLMMSAGLAVGATLKQMLVMDLFILFMLLLLPFSVPGTPLFHIWGFPASREGFLQAVEIGVTANAVILALMALVGSMDPTVLGQALHALKIPERLVHLLMFTIRYISVMKEEYTRMRGAMRARGFRGGASLHSYRSLGYLVGMMLIRAIERSERILGAMKCRGFTGRFMVSHPFRMTRFDMGFAIAFALVLLVLIAAEVAYGVV
ncbi:MAG: cobalt ECF transporter T component CbiQ [Rhodobacterales bacterium]|nr:MAG: cobalt ECF transporter T component CbiQ [Rhodobacterales bacterium]